MIETLEIEPEPQGGLDDHDGFVFVFLIKATRLCSVRRFGSALCYEYPASCSTCTSVHTFVESSLKRKFNVEFAFGIGIINSLLAHLLFDKDSTNLHSHH